MITMREYTVELRKYDGHFEDHLWTGAYQAESLGHAAEQFFEDPDLLLPEANVVVIALVH